MFPTGAASLLRWLRCSYATPERTGRDPRPARRCPARPPSARSRSTRCPTTSTSSARPGASTATGRPTWRWPRPRRPAATPASWPASWPRRSTPTRRRTWSGVEVAGPGFVNFRLRRHVAARRARRRRRRRRRRLRPASTSGCGHQVNVEFVSANPTGPVHAGHGRGAAYGDSLARLLERCGYDVAPGVLPERPWRARCRRFAASLAGPQGRRAGARGRLPGRVHHRVGRRDARRRRPVDVGRRQPGHRRTIARRWGGWTPLRRAGSASALDRRREPMRGRRSPTCAARGMVYEEDGAVWLRTTDFGDDKDRVLVQVRRRVHLPAARHRLPPRQVLPRASTCSSTCWGADHHGYVARMKAAMQALGHEPGRARGADRPARHLAAGGEPVRLSKRAGDIVELRRPDRRGRRRRRPAHLPAAARSTARRPSTSTWSPAESMDNPVFYVQMAHARIRVDRARGRRARASSAARSTDVDLALLVHERELDVLRSLSELPDVVRSAATERAPHKITTWVRELAGAFHGFYHDCYVIGDGRRPELTQARLWLVEAARIGLAIGLDLLGCQRPGVDVSVGHESRATDERPARHLLPDTAAVGADGQLSIGGCDVARAGRASSARRCSSTTRRTCGPAAARPWRRSATGSPTPPRRSCAWPWPGSSTRRACTSTWPPAASCHVALAGRRARRPPGAARQQQVDRRAARRPGRAGVGRIVVDSFDELDRLERAARRGLAGARRCWCGSRPASRPTPTSSCRPARTTRSSASARRPATPRARRRAGRGVGRRSSSSASTPTSAARSSSPTSSSRRSRCSPRSCGDSDLPELSIGGGLGVAYVEGEEAPTITEWGTASVAACRDAGITARVTAEPGRAIVARPRVTLYTVGTIKDLPGIRTYVSVDGGMSDNPRPVLYGSGYEAFLPRARRRGPPASVRVVGKHCESGDVLVRDAQVPADLRRRRLCRHAGHRCLRPLDGLQLQQGAPPRRRLRAPTARPGSSCGARPIDDLLATDVAPDVDRRRNGMRPPIGGDR